MDHDAAEVAHVPQTDAKAIDTWLKGLWDRAKKTAELISRLREEKGELQSKVTSMEGELTRLKQELTKHEEVIRTLSAAPGQEGGHSFFSDGEKEQLSAKVKDLLMRLDGYV